MLHIAGNYYLDADTYNLILKEKSVVTAGPRTKPENVGAETYRDLGYYSRIRDVADGLISHVARKTISAEETVTYNQFISTLRTFADELYKRFDEIEGIIKRGEFGANDGGADE